MKNIKSSIAFFLMFVITTWVSAQSNKNFSFTPENPKPGDKITVSYNPAGSNLEKADKISILVHSYGKTIYLTDEYDLMKEGTNWVGSFTTSDTSAGVVLRFTDGQEYDNNGSECYTIRFVGEDGKLEKYASSGLATGYASWFRAFNIDSDPEKALKLFQEELTIHPSVKKEIFLTYYNAYKKVNKEEASEFLKTETENFENTLTQSEEDLDLLMQLYTELNAEDKMEKTKALILEKYPTGESTEMIKFREAYRTKDAAKKTELAGKFKTQFPRSIYIPYLFPDPIQILINNEKYEEAFETIKKDEKSTSNKYNNLAWTMYEKDANLKLAKEIAAQGVELIGKEVQSSETKKPPYYSDREFKKIMSASSYAMLDTYGAILLKLGENAEALKYMKQAYNLDGGKNPEVNERYSQALVANGKFAEAIVELENFILGGESTSAMKNLLKQAYSQTKGSDAGFDEYLSGLELKANETAINEIKKMMINEPAPQFSLVDLNGESVSLADLKGKVVVLDFWATWCGPCKVSFPMMQKAVNKYKDNHNVVFLFINTWQKEKDKKKIVEDFIKETEYTFHILLDTEDKVVNDYKVIGIPSKFVIDKSGNIRFNVSGFSGSDDAAIAELSIMIELAGT